MTWSFESSIEAFVVSLVCLEAVGSRETRGSTNSRGRVGLALLPYVRKELTGLGPAQLTAVFVMTRTSVPSSERVSQRDPSAIATALLPLLPFPGTWVMQ